MTLLDPPAGPEALAGQTLALLGYGSQGRAHALNLRDSGLVSAGRKPIPKRPGARKIVQPQDRFLLRATLRIQILD